jgi:adenine-specific DNA-methyltransferase
VIEYVLLYSVNQNVTLPKRSEVKTTDEYIYKIQELGKPEEVEIGGKKVKIFTPDKYKVLEMEPSFSLFKKISIRGSIREKNSSGRFFVKNLEKLKAKYPAETLFRVPDMGDDSFGDRYFYLPPKGNINGGYYQGKPESSDTTLKPYPNFFNFVEEYSSVASEGEVDFRNGKKPEELLRFLIEIFTTKDSVVMDYHLGSGTTCAVAHKMGRKYVGIEQMDYGKDDSVVRLQNVIKGDSFGVSNSLGWEGGGSFVYAELAKANQVFVDKIGNAKNEKELLKVWDEMKKTAFLSYKIKPEDIDNSKKDFQSLSLNDQKRFLIAILDKNLLYVPYSEIDDKTYKISKEDKELNRKFYDNK